jgi:plastocyanin
MKKRLLFMLFCALTLQAAFAGKIHGTVRAQTRLDSTSTNAETHQSFVVFIEGITTTNLPTDLAPTVNVEARRAPGQRGAIFSPHLLPVMRGTTVRWLNSDQVYHNVFSMSAAASFEMGQSEPVTDLQSPAIKQYTFDKPGRVDVLCSIHANMNCIIYVMDNPWFSGTDRRGYYLIANLPSGIYKLRAWGERVPSQVKEITVTEDSDETIDFVLGWAATPDPAPATNTAPTITTNTVPTPAT